MAEHGRAGRKVAAWILSLLAMCAAVGQLRERHHNDQPSEGGAPEGGDLGPTLDRGTVSLSYEVHLDRTLLRVGWDRGSRVHVLPIGESDLVSSVRGFRLLIPDARARSRFGSKRIEALDRLGRRLFKTLVEPAADVIDHAQRLLIIPDGPLVRLPFGALARDLGRSGSGRQYLVEWKPLHVAISTADYSRLRRTRSDPGHGARAPLRIAAFGDPYGSERGGPIPSAAAGRASDRRYSERSLLPHSRREVEELARLFASEDVRVFLGREATEERVLTLGPEVQILHIATHGYLSSGSWLDSALALAAPGRQRQDGLLRVREIAQNLRLDADLVVLSACRTALGYEHRDSSFFGLAHAFREAGARTVVGSLWGVDDQATAELMVRFYRHLRAGETKDRSLRGAQIELLRGSIEARDEIGRQVRLDASAPYYWAAFQILGDWR